MHRAGVQEGCRPMLPRLSLGAHSPQEDPEWPWVVAAKGVTCLSSHCPPLTPTILTQIQPLGPKQLSSRLRKVGRVSRQRGLPVWPRGAPTLAFTSHGVANP